MPAPTISATSSYLGFKRNEAWAFQPSGTNSPYDWEAEGLPPNATMDTPAQFAATGVTATDIITATGNDFVNGGKVWFRSKTGGASLALNTIYFVRDKSGHTFKLAATSGGAALDLGSDISDAQIQRVSTGRMTSTGETVQGVYVVIVTARNADGIGTREFTIGITSGAATVAGSADTAIDLSLDVVSGLVTLGSSGASPLAPLPAQAPAMLAWIKSGDTRMFAIRAYKDGARVDPNFTSLRMVFKEFEPEQVIVDSGAFEKVGSGATALWNLPVTVTPANVDPALSGYEADAGTGFTALTEIEWKRDVTHNAATLQIVGTSRTFQVALNRDMAKV